MEARKRTIADAEALVRRLRREPFELVSNGRNNWVFVSSNECISIPLDPATTTYSVRVAAMKLLTDNGIPTTPLIEHGRISDIEYVITRKVSGHHVVVSELSLKEQRALYRACGHVLRQVHDLPGTKFGRLDGALTGSHNSWNAFVEYYFFSSLRRLTADLALSRRWGHRLERCFLERYALMSEASGRVLHGDFHLGNVLFDDGPSVTALLDLDIVMSGDAHWDTAHFSHTCKGNRDELLRAFCDGYELQLDPERIRFYAMVIWTRKIASQAETRRSALAESLRELERILNG